MGCTKSISSQEGRLPSLPFLAKFQDIFDLKNPLNINQKYTYLIEILDNKVAGHGVFQTAAYNCKTTREQLLKKRKQFWQTRTTGDKNNWETIKQAIESPDESEAKNLIRKCGLTMINQSIQMCIDAKLMRYEVPIFCLNDPIKYSKVDLAHANLDENFTHAKIKITIRNTKRQDIQLQVSNTIKIQQLKKKYLKGDTTKRVRFFSQGRQLVDDNSLGHYKILSQAIIQSLIL